MASSSSSSNISSVGSMESGWEFMGFENISKDRSLRFCTEDKGLSVTPPRHANYCQFIVGLLLIYNNGQPSPEGDKPIPFPLPPCPWKTLHTLWSSMTILHEVKYCYSVCYSASRNCPTEGAPEQDSAQPAVDLPRTRDGEIDYDGKPGL